jgi:hypothetical protein
VNSSLWLFVVELDDGDALYRQWQIVENTFDPSFSSGRVLLIVSLRDGQDFRCRGSIIFLGSG